MEGEIGTHICCSSGCGKPASLACPTCLKLGLPPSRFCGQECFKGYWNVHKELHKAVKQARIDVKNDLSQLPTEFSGFNFTGNLRPYQKSEKKIVPDHIMKPDYALHPLGIPLSEERDKRTNASIRIYTPEEIQGIREACRIGREVLDIASAALRPGITCDEIDCIVSHGLV